MKTNNEETRAVAYALRRGLCNIQQYCVDRAVLYVEPVLPTQLPISIANTVGKGNREAVLAVMEGRAPHGTGSGLVPLDRETYYHYDTLPVSEKKMIKPNPESSQLDCLPYRVISLVNGNPFHPEVPGIEVFRRTNQIVLLELKPEASINYYTEGLLFDEAEFDDFADYLSSKGWTAETVSTAAANGIREYNETTEKLSEQAGVFNSHVFAEDYKTATETILSEMRAKISKPRTTEI